VKRQFVLADTGLGRWQHGLVGSAVGIGHERLQQLPAAFLEDGEVDAHADAWPAGQVVEYVSGNSGHDQLPR
jgi:hypothetical protein